MSWESDEKQGVNSCKNSLPVEALFENQIRDHRPMISINGGF